MAQLVLGLADIHPRYGREAPEQAADGDNDQNDFHLHPRRSDPERVNGYG